MHIAKQLLAIAAITALGLGTAQAGTVTQTKSFDATTGNLSGTGSFAIGGTDYFSAAFSAFNGSLGTLNGFTVTWTASFSGTFEGSNSGGSMALNGMGGGYSLNGLGYGGDNMGGGKSGVGTVTLSASADDTTGWLAANAGRTYNPALLAAVTGSGPVNLTWSSGGPSVSYSGILSGQGSLVSSVTLTYDYTAAASTNDVPEPASLALVAAGLLAAGAVRRRRTQR